MTPLALDADPSVYTVHQEIVRSGAADADPHAPEDILLSIVYQFNNVTHTPPLSPDSPTFSSDASRPGTAGSHFSSGSTVSFCPSPPKPAEFGVCVLISGGARCPAL